LFRVERRSRARRAGFVSVGVRKSAGAVKRGHAAFVGAREDEKPVRDRSTERLWSAVLPVNRAAGHEAEQARAGLDAGGVEVGEPDGADGGGVGRGGRVCRPAGGQVRRIASSLDLTPPRLQSRPRSPAAAARGAWRLEKPTCRRGQVVCSFPHRREVRFGEVARRSFGQVRCDLLLQIDPSASSAELVTS